MFLLRRPTSDQVEQFLQRSRSAPLSYGPVGLASNPTAAYNADRTNAVIGRGQSDFERARAALASWKQFDTGWTVISPSKAPVEPGSGVVLLIRHLGFWSLNGCRVLSVVGSADRSATFGFVYGTLTTHAESGEELFEVALNEDSGDVTYRIQAASRPRAALARFGYPVGRMLQAKFRRDSVAAMRRATRL